MRVGVPDGEGELVGVLVPVKVGVVGPGVQLVDESPKGPGRVGQGTGGRACATAARHQRTSAAPIARGSECVML